MLLIKDLEFSSNQADILPKLPIHELVILLKYQLDLMKIVDFLQLVYFESVLFFIAHTLSHAKKEEWDADLIFQDFQATKL